MGDGHSLSARCTLLSIFEPRLSGCRDRQPSSPSRLPDPGCMYTCEGGLTDDFTPVGIVCVVFLLAGYLVYEFDKFWLEEEPESIMYFNLYREKFHERIKGLLMDCNAVLTLKT